MKKIAIASRQVTGHSGATTIILEHIKRLSALGWDVHLYGEKLDIKRIREAGGIPHWIPRLPVGSLKRPAFAHLFHWITKNKKFDVIHGHGDILRQDIVNLHNCVHAAHELIHGKPIERKGVALIHERLLTENKFKYLIANSNLMKEDIVRRFSVDPNKIRVVYPGLNPNRFRPEDRDRYREPTRTLFGVKPGEILVGLVTSGDYKKRGVALFIESLARLKQESKEKIRAWIIGGETNLSLLKEKAAYAQMGNRIHFLPAIPNVETYYHALDLFVYPALFEEFGLSVQEALAVGLPVLTTKRVGATELLGKEGDGILLEKPDAALFAKKIEELINNKDLRDLWSRLGPPHVRQNTWDVNFQKVFELYRQITH